MSTELRQEINTVFNRSKFIKPDKKRRALLGTLFNQALMVLPQPLGEIVFPDENGLSPALRSTYGVLD